MNDWMRKWMNKEDEWLDGKMNEWINGKMTGWEK